MAVVTRQTADKVFKLSAEGQAFLLGATKQQGGFEMQKEHLEILLEDIRGKFDLVLEGHEVLRDEIRETRIELKKDIDLCNFKIDTLNQKIDGVDEKLSKKIDAVAADLKATDKRLSDKIDAVAADLKATDKRLSDKIDGVSADLKAHRADTEAHHGGVYLVKES